MNDLDLGYVLLLLDHRGELVDPPSDVRLAAAYRIVAAPVVDVERAVAFACASVDELDQVVGFLLRAAELYVQTSRGRGEVVDNPAPLPPDATIARLLALAADLGVPVRFATLDGARGRCSAGGIVVDPCDVDLAQVLGHELGHALDFRLELLGPGASRRGREQLADALGQLLRSVSTAAEAQRVARAYLAAEPAVDDGGLMLDLALLKWWESTELDGWHP